MNEQTNGKRGRKSDMRRQAGCAGKAPYPTYSEADTVVKAIRSHSNKPVMPYKCEYCQQYHVGRPLDKNRRHR